MVSHSCRIPLALGNHGACCLWDVSCPQRKQDQLFWSHHATQPEKAGSAAGVTFNGCWALERFSHEVTDKINLKDEGGGDKLKIRCMKGLDRIGKAPIPAAIYKTSSGYVADFHPLVKVTIAQ